MGVGENICTSLGDPGQCHQATEAGQYLTCPHDKVRTAHPIALMWNTNEMSQLDAVLTGVP